MSDYISTDPNAGLDDEYLSTDPDAGMKQEKKRQDVPKMSVGSVAQDLVSGALQIGPTAVKGVADITRLATGDRLGKDTSEAMKRGITSIQDVIGSDRAAAQRQNFEADMADESVNAWETIKNNKGALADMALPTVGSMFLPVGVAGAAGKVATIGKAAQAMQKAALTDRVAKVQKVAGIGTIAAQNAAETFVDLIENGTPMEDAYIAAGITVPFSVVAGVLTGGGAEGAITRAMTRTGAVKTGVAQTLKASGREGAQEMGEELGQITGKAVATGEAPAPNSALKQLSVAGTLGAVMGGGVDVASQLDGFGKPITSAPSDEANQHNQGGAEPTVTPPAPGPTQSTIVQDFAPVQPANQEDRIAEILGEDAALSERQMSLDSSPDSEIERLDILLRRDELAQEYADLNHDQPVNSIPSDRIVQSRDKAATQAERQAIEQEMQRRGITGETNGATDQGGQVPTVAAQGDQGTSSDVPASGSDSQSGVPSGLARDSSGAGVSGSTNGSAVPAGYAGAPGVNPEFDVSGRTDEQLANLVKAGKHGWREAAIAEVARRSETTPATPLPTASANQTVTQAVPASLPVESAAQTLSPMADEQSRPAQSQRSESEQPNTPSIRKPLTGEQIAPKPEPLAQTQGQAQGAEGTTEWVAKKPVEVTTPSDTKTDEVSTFDQRFPNIKAAEKVIKERGLKQVAVFKDGDQYRIGAKAKRTVKESDNLIQRIKQLGGINTRYRNDVIGDKAGAPGLFSNTGKGLDDLATTLKADGFNIDTDTVDGGVEALTNLIQRASIQGETILSMAGQERAAQKSQETDYRDKLKEEIDQAGGTYRKNATTKQLEATVEELRAKEAMMEREAIQSHVELADDLSDEIVSTAATEDEFMAAMGFTEKESNEINGITEKTAEGIADRSAQEGDGAGTGQGQDQAFELAGETSEEVKAREEAQAAKDKAESDRAKADEQPFIMTGSNRPADELAARGQQDIFSQKNSLNAPTPAQKAPDSAKRYDAGSKLTKEERKSVLKTLTDVYRSKHADKEERIAANGETYLAYPYQPELFEKSDITGKMVRFYVTLPDGSIAHPTELFPDYSQADVDRAIAEQIGEARVADENKKYRLKTLNRRMADTLNEANRIFNKENPVRADYVPAILTDGKKFIRTAPENAANDIELLGDDWRIQEGTEAKPEGEAPKFSRNAGQGIALRDLKAVTSRVKQSMANLPTVHVLSSPEQLDRADASQASLYDFIEQAGAMNDVEGATHDGEIYLFASGLADEARAEHVLATHEVTHYGLRAVFGTDLDTVLQSIWANNASVRKQATALRKRLGLKSNVAAVEEVLADMQPADLVKLKGWRKLVGVVRDWFNSHGFTALADRLDGWLKSGLTDQQQADLLVADVVNAARGWVKGGKRAGKAGRGTALLGSSSVLLQPTANGRIFDTESVRDFLEGFAVSEHLKPGSRIPSGGFAHPLGVLDVIDPVALKGRIDATMRNADTLGELLNSPAIKVLGFEILDAPSQRVVMDAVLMSAHNLKVRRSVVELIPVDVVNNLRRKQLSAKDLFGNESVFRDYFAANPDVFVSAMNAAAFAHGVAKTGRAAEVSTAIKDPLFSGVKGLSARLTSNSNHIERSISDGLSHHSTRFALVYHGTPHMWAPEPGFPHGRPRLDKMGSGEGNQAYGWGWYSAEAQSVAGSYASQLRNPVELDGKKPDTMRMGFAETATINYFQNRLAAKIGEDRARQQTAAWAKHNVQINGDMADAEIDAFIARLSEGKGNLYQLDIPDATLPYLLDWDRPLSEQTPEVRKALDKDFPQPTKREIELAQLHSEAKSRERSWTGGVVYGELMRKHGGDKAASEYLASLGIVGNRYLDGQSRNRPLKDIKREFLAELPEDADFDEVSELIGTGRFSPKNDALIKALMADEWLGFDYPAQAISAALSKDLGNYDASPALLRAVADAQEGATFNFVIWDQPTLDKIALLERNGEKLDAMRATGNQGTFDATNPDIRFSRNLRNLNPLQRAKAKYRQLTSQEAIDKVLYEVQDKYIDLRRLRDHIKKIGGVITDLNDAYLGEELYHKRLAKQTEDFLDNELKPLLAGLREHSISMEDFERFLHARHAPEANAKLAESNPNQQEIDAGQQQARATVKSLELQLQTANSNGTATRAIEQSLKQAREKLAQWNGAQEFRGTEAERLSLSGMSDQESAALMAAIPANKRVNYDRLAGMVDTINARTLDTLQRSGLMSKADLDTWRTAYQFYVPLYRDDAHPSDTSHPIGQGFSTRGDAARRRVGSNEQVTNILSHIAMQRESALTRAEKNMVMQKLYLMAKQNPLPDYWKPDAVPMVKVQGKDGFVHTVPDPRYKDSPNILMLRVGGKDVAIEFNKHNPQAFRLAQAMKNLDVDDLHYVIPLIGKGTRWMASVSTQYNPIFGVINFIRDVQGAALNLTTTELAGSERALMKDTIQIMSEVLKNYGRMPKTGRWGVEFDELQSVGGTTGYRDLYLRPEDRANKLKDELKALDRGNVKKAAYAVADWLSDYNEAMENAVRLAAYVAAKDKGMTNVRAASLAKNLTVNFNRKGRQTREIGALFAFFNAALQGTKRMHETLSGPAGKKIMAGGVLIGVLNTVIGMAMMGADGDDDDDNWEKIPEFIKERAIIIPISKDDYITIPMPLGFHFLPNIGRLATEFAIGGNDKTATKQAVSLAVVLADAFNPLGGSAPILQMAMPTVFDPIVALAQNKDWTGKQIYMENYSDLDPDPGYKLTKSTATPWSKAFTELINDVTGGTEYTPGMLSPTPDQIDYIIGQLTGGFGREIGKVAQTVESQFTGDELPPYKIPLVGRLYGNTRGTSGQATAFYENLKKANMIENEIKGRMKDGVGIDEYLAENPNAMTVASTGNRYESRVRKLRARRQDLAKRNAPRDELKAIDDMITATMKEFNREMSGN